MQSLTKRQTEIFEMIRNFIDKSGMPPTRMDICAHFGFRSPTAAEDHLKALERKGVINLQSGMSRGIQLVNELLQSGLPVIGRVAAGAPILAEEHIEGHFDLERSQFKPKPDYLLRVRGQSMRDIGILNNDLLAVHRTNEARSGQVIVARLDDEVTVKRFRRRGNKVTLLAENPDFKPIEVNLRDEDFNVEGLAVGVVRSRVT
ncbi:MAG: transcriptional repressor LexA [Gammaproteobacteria bacterium]|nr:transcriptional repressor LexA [Gammaproteobacteria bacterium]